MYRAGPRRTGLKRRSTTHRPEAPVLGTPIPQHRLFTAVRMYRTGLKSRCWAIRSQHRLFTAPSTACSRRCGYTPPEI
jgi:hypothetical protein